MKKFLFVLFLLTMAFPTVAFAYETKLEEAEILKNEVSALSQKYNYLTIDFNKTVDNKQEPLKFDTVEEFEVFIKELKLMDEQVLSFDSNNHNQKNELYRGVISSGVDTVSWYSPLIGATFAWKNVTFEYTYEYDYPDKTFLSVDNVESYLTGVLVALDWTQTGYASTVGYNGNSISAEVDGYYLLGVEIGGTPIGAKVNSTWYATLESDSI